uniref:Uncharacterized protein n=1 Tax=Arundo donax TaxID=35708 RepID=A0A0A8YSU8_ARUDO
MLLESCTSVY